MCVWLYVFWDTGEKNKSIQSMQREKLRQRLGMQRNRAWLFAELKIDVASALKAGTAEEGA